MAVSALKWPYNRIRVAAMSLRDNKMAILRQLGLESDRRWLGLLVEEGTVKKSVRGGQLNISQ